jgi:4-hydroxybenzoate polyprenyltransferase
VLAAALTLLSALLILPLSGLVWQLAVVAVFLAASYPFTKRFFAIPQAYLGIAFGFGIPMAFAAVQDTVPPLGWWMLAANIAWAIAYDTEYAMVDRNDDLRIGIKTSAITFGRFDVTAVMFCYGVAIAILTWIGTQLHYGAFYFSGLAVATGIALYHWTLIRDRERMRCFKAFLHNNWLGAAVFAGIVGELNLRPLL